MSGSVFISGSTKEEKYIEVLPQIKALIEVEDNLIANLANISAVLKEVFKWHWVGFYIKEKDQLVLGPFQGPLACTRIPVGRGVCGTVASENKTLIVPNVHEFSGHIACSSLTNSEIVVPIQNTSGAFELLLDIDSIEFDDFDKTDQKHLEALAKIIQAVHF